ncbi:voltage-gated potassium channel [Deinococcus reticulitermitis]|uniref:Voltage-gated potassium channel n=1 Tax=Deinococcus reticulitermitis TaxID=856736 RepID=A0A1H7B723_9DEIO|nr:two pore domain potassium channel family protein [Deinococcus reticulitermitis]SEJ73489.1 voltage-gated potassium channel [Deinococcus reticulitermitis]
MTAPDPPPSPEQLRGVRLSTLRSWDELLDGPLNLLGLVWLGLLVWELLGPVPGWVGVASDVIWGVFVLDFLLSLLLAPEKGAYLRRNWLSALSLLLPALRALRFFRGARLLRAARVTRGTRLFRILTRLNRGLRSLQRSLRRRHFGFVALATGVVTLAGAAGMASFEGFGAGMPEAAPRDFLGWVYWTGMLLTSLGPEYWPRTGEGRALTFLLGVYGLAVFGYITATLASFFIGSDQEREPGESGADGEEVNNAALFAELRALRREVAALRGAEAQE